MNTARRARTRLSRVREQVRSAHELAQEELRAAENLNVDQVHAELVATAAAVLMRAIALELRARRAAAQRAEERRMNRLGFETRDLSPAGTPSGGDRVEQTEEFPGNCITPPGPPSSVG